MTQDSFKSIDEYLKKAVANKLRELISSVLTEELEDQDWMEVLSDLTNAQNKVNKFATGQIASRIMQFKGESGDPDFHFVASPISGIANAIALPIQYIDDDGTDITAIANFPNQYEGPPTCVHGGIIASVFDEVLGAANSRHGRPGLTGTLKVKYKSPTPLNKDLIIKSRVKDISDRKVTTEGEIYYDGNLTAKAEGLFISVDPEKFLNIARNHAGEEAVELLKKQWGPAE